MANPNEDETTMNELVRTRAYVVQNEVKLKEVFGEDYIAVYGNVVVASRKDRKDKPALIEEVARRIGKRPVLIGTVDEIVSPAVVEMSRGRGD